MNDTAHLAAILNSVLAQKYQAQLRNQTREKSTRKEVNQHLINMTQIQPQRPETPTVTLTWHACQYKVHKLHQRYILKQEKMLPVKSVNHAAHVGVFLITEHAHKYQTQLHNQTRENSALAGEESDAAHKIIRAI